MKVREGYYSEQVRNRSFEEIQDDLNDLQQQVYKIVKEHEPIYTEKIAELLHKFPHTVTPRVLELRKLGLVEFAGTGKSSTSGVKVSLWKVTKPGEIQLNLL